MENKENFYDKTPFYMTYPLQNLYVAEMEYERDLERMKELYPRQVQQLLQLIARRCDELEQEGSRMYDENPDRYMMEREACELYERFLKENPQPMPNPNPNPQTQLRPNPQPQPRQNRFAIVPPEEFKEMFPPTPSRPQEVYPEPMAESEEIQMQERGRCHDSWLCSLIGVLFSDEVYRRRCRHRRCRRWSM